MAEDKEFLTYKGRPLVRSGDTIYYGDTKEKYIVCLKINSKKKVDDLEIADSVTVQLMYSDEDIRSRDRVIKTSTKPGLYDAMDIGAIWLERALKEN